MFVRSLPIAYGIRLGERARPSDPFAELAVIPGQRRIALPGEDAGQAAETAGLGRRRQPGKRAYGQGSGGIGLAAADVEPDEQA